MTQVLEWRYKPIKNIFRSPKRKDLSIVWHQRRNIRFPGWSRCVSGVEAGTILRCNLGVPSPHQTPRQTSRPCGCDQSKPGPPSTVHTWTKVTKCSPMALICTSWGAAANPVRVCRQPWIWGIFNKQFNPGVCLSSESCRRERRFTGGNCSKWSILNCCTRGVMSKFNHSSGSSKLFPSLSLNHSRSPTITPLVTMFLMWWRPLSIWILWLWDSVGSNTFGWTSQEHQRRHVAGQGPGLAGLTTVVLSYSIPSAVAHSGEGQNSVSASQQGSRNAGQVPSQVSESQWDSAASTSATKCTYYFIGYQPAFSQFLPASGQVPSCVVRNTVHQMGWWAHHITLVAALLGEQYNE